MTKEELKKEAIKYAVDYPTSYGKGYKHKDLRIAYLAGAEPREKQIQIDAEQIRALQKQNGELTDELAKKADTNHQLVEQMAKLSEENAELKQANEGKVVEHFEAYGQCRDSRRIAELEKENAELKKKNLDTQDAVTMQMYTNKANKEIADKQLTKAKEIIKKMIEAIHIWDCKNLEEVEAEAEQFLNEVEK